MLKEEFLLREYEDWPLSLLESQDRSLLSVEVADSLQEPRSESALRELQAELLLRLCSSLTRSCRV